MLKREFKVNLKSFLIWTGILIGIFLFTFSIYPFIINDESLKSMDELMKSMPPEFLKSFNMDITSISTAYGWLKSEGFMFVLLIVGFYSSLLGSSIVLKEENDKTIEYIGSLPITRNKIMTNKIIVAITYIIGMVLLLGLFNYIALTLSGDFDKTQYLLLSITPLFIGLPLFGLNLFISTFLHKTKKTVGISLGLVFLFYIVNMISEIAENVNFLKYFSIYTLADIRNVISKVEINPIMILISLIITVVFIIISYIRYNKKELV